MPRTRTTMPKQEQSTELEVAIGVHLKTIREAAGVPRELLAAAARQEGLPWQTNTLSLIEVGRRRVTTGELILLPHVLMISIPPAYHPRDEHTQTRRPFRLSDLIPEGEQMALTPHRRAYGPWVRTLIQAECEQTKDFMSDTHLAALSATDVPSSLHDEVTLRIAKAMRKSPSIVADAAAALWGCSFLAKRDAELKTQITDGTPLRRIQALRGHIARELIVELKNSLTPKGGRHVADRTRRKQ